MKRGFQGAPRPLLPSMLLVAINPNAGQEHAAQAPSQPSSSSPTAPPPPPIPTPTPPPPPIPTPPPPPIPTPTPPPITTSPPPPIPTPTPPPTSPPPPPPETEPTTDEYIYEEQSPVHPHFSPVTRTWLQVHAYGLICVQAVQHTVDFKNNILELRSLETEPS
ncbi:hypothetical protein Tco_0857692 [Tanacetum coccineum]|uniref:Uncharacterized protein n=1 Tax=Tanacetum coccineum TaxID=301880 RepID=A0ABQ5B6Y6_9ASTR